ncbi:MAG: DNA polymerase III subunit delta [Chloroflexi bacterium]|nr:DNA polymerase III subunit delta [Chloroflexota bacterium]
MSKRTPTFYVFHGPDEFSLQAQLSTMREQMGDPATAELNITVLDGKVATPADVIASASAMPFLSDKRLVIVDGLLSWLARKGAGKAGKAVLEELAAELPHLPSFARVVFVEPDKLSDRHPILQLAITEPGGYHKLFDPPRNPVRWITNQATNEYQTEIMSQAAAALAAVVGEDLRAADNELAKLAAYVDGDRPISPADVALLTSYVAEPDVFAMVDAIGKRDGATALQLLHRLLAEDEPLRLFGMIIRQFRLLILAREYLDAGGSPNGIAQAIGVHPFVGEKLGQQVRAFSIAQLEQIYRFLLETDAGIKTGKVGDVLALDLLVAGIST